MSSQKPNLDQRIGIIGAGASGLSAAEILKAKGYRHVTLLERSRVAGGKCCTLQYKGRAYELGAAVVSGSDGTIMDLVKKYHIPVKRVRYGKNLLLDAHTGLPLKDLTLAQKVAFIYQLLFRYRKLYQSLPRIDEPGLSQLDTELSLPFAKWSERHEIPLVAQEFANYFTGWGYGYCDEVPAAYVLKHYAWKFIRATIRGRLYTFPNGIQGLWETVAKEHEVLYNTTIKRITRTQIVTVETDKGALEFDRLIITSPLDEALQFLDAGVEEKELFKKITHVDYRTYACSIKGFSKQTTYIPGNFKASRAGHPLFWFAPYADSDLYTCYILGDWKLSDEEATRNIARLVEPLGGTLQHVERAVHWKYFPHVSSPDMRAGFYDRLEALQGTNHTYYAGELLNFSSVDQSAGYAERLIERFF